MIPTSRDKPTSHQTHLILNDIYRFRFTTSNHLSSILNTSNIKTIHSRLTALTKSGHIYRHYSSANKLLHIPAYYSLDTFGARVLRLEGEPYSQRALRLSRRDEKATPGFITRCQIIRGIIAKLESDTLHIETKSQVTRYDYMPDKLPDAFLTHTVSRAKHQYFLEYIESSVSFKDTMARLRRYITYIDNGDWDETELDFPRVLLVCDTPMMERRLQRYVSNSLDDIDEDELKFYTTTLEKLGDARAKAWTYMLEPDDLMNLSGVSKHV